MISVVNAGWDVELEKLAFHLKVENVPVLLIKGAAMQGPVYREAGLRLMDDADWILRNPEDMEAVCRSLQSCGYQKCDDIHSNIWNREGYLIDLHSGILGDDRVSHREKLSEDAEARTGIVEGIWSRSLPSRLGEHLRVPASEDHMIILCSHIMKHNFEPGIWFADLEAIIERESHFDWEVCIERAKSWNIFRPLAYALQEMDETRMHLPRKAANALREIQPTRLDKFLLKLASEGVALRGEKVSWIRPPLGNLLRLSSQPTLGAKFRLLWEAAFPRGEVMADIYSDYRAGLRWWFMARRTADLARLGLRVLALRLPGREEK